MIQYQFQVDKWTLFSLLYCDLSIQISTISFSLFFVSVAAHLQYMFGHNVLLVKSYKHTISSFIIMYQLVHFVLYRLTTSVLSSSQSCPLFTRLHINNHLPLEKSISFKVILCGLYCSVKEVEVDHK